MIHSKGRAIDWGTCGGLLLAVAGILGGLILEGGHFQDVAQLTAAAIVMGGTMGAVLISKPFSLVRAACKRLPGILLAPVDPDADELAAQLVELARKVRRAGITSLEQEAHVAEDGFLAKALGIAADGVDSRELRQIMELDIDAEYRRFEAEASVFESAGGYAPTIGIIGAVLGLIQVMKHLDHLEEVGRGIAVAFVATLYGVALANLLLLPIATRIRARGRDKAESRELILNGVLAIAAGTNPRLIELHLDAYRTDTRGKEMRPTAVHAEKVMRIG